jgi:hypothetical protein
MTSATLYSLHQQPATRVSDQRATMLQDALSGDGGDFLAITKLTGDPELPSIGAKTTAMAIILFCLLVCALHGMPFLCKEQAFNSHSALHRTPSHMRFH